VASELTIAAWAVLAWGLLPDGELRSTAFVLATISLVATLLVNASSFLRFDGYFILCDLLDIPNLYARCFALAREESTRWAAASSGFSDDSRERLLVSQQEWAMAEAELASVNEDLARYRPVAPFSGRLRDIDPDLKTGQRVMANERLAVLVGPRAMQVETYLSEESVKRIAVGDKSIFHIASRTGPVLKIQVASIDEDASRLLPDGKLTAQAGGHILIRDVQEGKVPELAMCRVMLDAEGLPEAFEEQSWRRRVIIRGAAGAPAARYLRNIIAVLVRESGL
jgi:putative peptide zinc metalloprotease protein